MIKTSTKIDLRMEGFKWLTYPRIQFLTKGFLGRNSKEALGDRNGSKDHGGMLLLGLLSNAFSDCFLISSRTFCLGMTPPTVGYALPH